MDELLNNLDTQLFHLKQLRHQQRRLEHKIQTPPQHYSVFGYSINGRHASYRAYYEHHLDINLRAQARIKARIIAICRRVEGYASLTIVANLKSQAS